MCYDITNYFTKMFKDILMSVFRLAVYLNVNLED